MAKNNNNYQKNLEQFNTPYFYRFISEQNKPTKMELIKMKKFTEKLIIKRER